MSENLLKSETILLYELIDILCNMQYITLIWYFINNGIL